MIIVETEMDKMPKCCDDCGYCRVRGEIVKLRLFCEANLNDGNDNLDKVNTTTARPEWCPLREV